MVIIPAIDIREGKCVGTFRGNYELMKAYADNPVTYAKQWEKKGAKMLHFVDLDGAREGRLVNIDLFKRIRAAIHIPFEVGGGIRTKANVDLLLSMGIDRVVVGTIAVTDPNLLKQLVKDYGTKIAIALDLKNNNVVAKGWQFDTKKTFMDIALMLKRSGIHRIIITDTLKDGMLESVDIQKISQLLDYVKVPTIYSGGLVYMADLKKLQMLGVEAVIIGRALREGKIELQHAQDELDKLL